MRIPIEIITYNEMKTKINGDTMKKNSISIRRDLHQIPELDISLPLTFQYVYDFLSTLSCKIESLTPSSICAYFSFQQVHTIAYRSDMDALAINEENTHAYISKHPGMMHACGHDGHMAILLDFAQYVSSLTSCEYNVLLIFQPAEETTGGAKLLCDSGILKNKNVFAMFGIHLWPNEEVGTILTKPGYLMARSSEVHFQLFGKSTHVATYSQGIDTIISTNKLIKTIYDIFPSNERYLLKFGFLHAGSIGNCISQEAVLKGSLRTYDENLHLSIIKELRQISERIEKETGCHILMNTTPGYPPLKNDEILYQHVVNNIANIKLATSNFLSDDFSFYAKEIPSIYFYLGTGKNIALHSTNFNIDEATLPYGVALYKHLLMINYKLK